MCGHHFRPLEAKGSTFSAQGSACGAQRHPKRVMTSLLEEFLDANLF
jgi:hypothetical protein